MSEGPRCTMTFATDLRNFPSNPHKAMTPFGLPQTVSIGDAFAELETLTTRAEAAEAEVKRLREALEVVARWAWRTDPPNTNFRLTDTERLSMIKHHPTVKEFAAPHIALAEKESSNDQ